MRYIRKRSLQKIYIKVQQHKPALSTDSKDGRLKNALLFLRDLSFIILAAAAFIISLKSWQDSRSIQALDIKPVIYARANLVFDSKSTLTLYNKGPNDIQQLEIDFYIQSYSEKLNQFFAEIQNSDFHYDIGLLEAKKGAVINIFPALTYQVKSREDLRKAGDKGVGLSAIELRLSYRCLPDYRKYIESAVYFVTDDGKIVGEHNSLISNKEPYISMSKQLFEKIRKDLGFEWMKDKVNSDDLHLINPID